MQLRQYGRVCQRLYIFGIKYASIRLARTFQINCRDLKFIITLTFYIFHMQIWRNKRELNPSAKWSITEWTYLTLLFENTLMQKYAEKTYKKFVPILLSWHSFWMLLNTFYSLKGFFMTVLFEIVYIISII